MGSRLDVGAASGPQEEGAERGEMQPTWVSGARVLARRRQRERWAVTTCLADVGHRCWAA